MPPPQSETDVQVVQKEVAETVRILESLKLGGKSVGGMKGASIEGSLSSIRDSGVSATDEIAKARANGQPSLNEPQRGSSRPGARRGRAVPARAVAGEEAAKEELERVKSMLRNTVDDEDEGEEGGDATTREECVRSLRQRPANDLKVELKALRLHAKGRKPDLVQRLADHYFGPAPVVEEDEKEEEVEAKSAPTSPPDKIVVAAAADTAATPETAAVPDTTAEAAPVAPITTNRAGFVSSFAGISPLSAAASSALTNAGFEPSPIQVAAIPRLNSNFVRTPPCPNRQRKDSRLPPPHHGNVPSWK